MVRPDIEQKKIALTLKLTPDTQPMLGDDVRLKQVFWNVTKNAVKFTPAGGDITVETRILPEAGKVIVQVTDTGIGMTASEIARAFEAFSQGDHARVGNVRRYGGLGLGLAISRTLVELHGGTIKAESPGRNQGTSFKIELPVRVKIEPTVPADA